MLIVLVFSYAYTFATPPATKYNAGETLDPTCIPGDTNCTVDTKPSQWITTGSDIYYNDGNVGIGTDNPTSKLDIRVGEITSNIDQGFSENDGNGDSLDDATFSGTYNQSYDNYIYVQIDSEGTPDTFSYWDDNGDCSGSNVSITGSSQYICDGISITFSSTTGHSLNDEWYYGVYHTSSITSTNPVLNISDGINNYFTVNAVAPNSTFIGTNAGSTATNAQNSIFIGQNAGKNDTVNNTSNGLSSILIGSFTNTGGYSNSILLGSGTSGSSISNTKANQFMLAPSITEMRLRGVDYTLPSSQGGAGTFLTNNGTGTLSWGSITSSQWTTSGSNIYYNSGNVGIGTSNPLYKLHITSTLSSSGIGGYVATSTSGSSDLGAGTQIRGWKSNLLAGYTGNSGTSALEFFNLTSGTGNNPYPGVGRANFGVIGDSRGATSGVNVGAYLQALNGSTNYGVMGGAPNSNNSPTNNIGILGWAYNSTNNVGGYFGLFYNTTPVFESAALIADNGSTTSPIFLARDNGTKVFVINDGGNVGIGTASPEAALNVVGDKILLQGDGNGLYLDDAINVLNVSGLFGGLGDEQIATLNSVTDTYKYANGNIVSVAGNVGIGTTSPTATLHLKAGTATAGTAPLKFTSGTNLTTPEQGVMEYNGTNLYFTPSATRKTIAFTEDIASSQWTTTGSNIYYNSGNVGIGTATPTSALSVVGNIAMTGDIIPTVNDFYTLGSPSFVWKDLYVGAGSIYVDGQKVLQTDLSDSVVVSADDTQNLILKTTGGGNIELNPASGGGAVLLKSNVTLTAGKTIRTSDSSPIIFSDGISTPSITTSVLNGGIAITPNGIGNTYVTSGNFGIGTTSPAHSLVATGDVLFGNGNLNSTKVYIGSTNASLQYSNSLTSAPRGLNFYSDLGNFAFGTGYEGTTSLIIRSQKFGFGGISGVVPSYLISLYGNSVQTIGMERNTTAATAGQGLTLLSGGAYSGGTDLVGGDLSLKSGISTGTGTSAIRFFTATAGSTGTADNTPTEKMTILGNGNVGIGSQNPLTPLTVRENNLNNSPMTLGIASGAFSILSNAGAYGLYAGVENGNGDAWMQVGRNDGNATAYNLLLNPTGGNIGIGTEGYSASEKLVIQSAIGASMADPTILLYPHHMAVGETSAIEFAFQTYTLDPHRLARIESKLIGITSGNQAASLDFQTVDAGSALTSRMYIRSNGNVGIGTTSPSYILEVGNSSISGVVARFQNSTGTCDINPTTSSLSCSSDINLKKNITNIKDNTDYIYNDSIVIDNDNTSILYKLNLLTPVKYNWNKEDDNDTKHIGFIAQEVEQVFPDLVFTDPETNLKSISYTNFIPYTISAIQELDLKVKSFEEGDLSVSGSMVSRVKDFLANEFISIRELSVGLFRINGNVCVDDVCITKDEFKEMLLNAKQSSGTSGGTYVPPLDSDDQGSTNSDTSADTSESENSTTDSGSQSLENTDITINNTSENNSESNTNSTESSDTGSTESNTGNDVQ